MRSPDPVIDHINRSEIKRRRLARKLSRRHAAILGGFQGASLAQRWREIECATPDIKTSTLIRVAKALGCQIGDLVTVQK